MMTFVLRLKLLISNQQAIKPQAMIVAAGNKLCFTSKADDLSSHRLQYSLYTLPSLHLHPSPPNKNFLKIY